MNIRLIPIAALAALPFAALGAAAVAQGRAGAPIASP